MGAELELIASPRAFKLRFGSAFHSSSARDRYFGCGAVEDWGEFCSIGPLVSLELLGELQRNEILAACAAEGFERAQVERHGRLWVYDLRSRGFKRSEPR